MTECSEAAEQFLWGAGVVLLLGYRVGHAGGDGALAVRSHDADDDD